MRCKSLVLAVTAGLGGIAAAQPGPPPQPPPPPVDTTTGTDPLAEPDPAPTQQTVVVQQPQPEPTQPVMQPAPAPEPQGTRPDGFAVGLGLGYQLPTSLQTPNITSARFRLAGGMTIEPAFAILNETENQETGIGEATDKHTQFSINVLGRLPLISRGKVDLEVLARLAFANDKVNPEGDLNTTTTNVFALGYGLAVGYWFSPHWQLSMNVVNDLITYAAQKQQSGPGMTVESSATGIGLIFDPTVFMMLHLYN